MPCNKVKVKEIKGENIYLGGFIIMPGESLSTKTEGKCSKKI
jgi:hypothetical protein